LYNHCWSGKAISVTYSECVSVAIFIQHAERMRRVVFSCVTCLPLPYFFSTLSHKRHNIRENSYSTQNVCSDFLYNFFSETFFSLKRVPRDIVINVLCLHIQYPLFLTYLKLTLFPFFYSKTNQMHN